MKKIFLSILTTLLLSSGFAQHQFTATIRDKATKEPLIGATAILVGTTNGATSNVNGVVILNDIPEGKQIIAFSYVGYASRVDTLYFPLADKTYDVLLESEAEEMEEVIVRATRSSRTIADIPTRIEAISGEELEEKGNMKPGDIRMLLNESTGIQTQQTSATSYNSSIRIQGLDGKYTQILKDGLPLYAGFSGGLSLLQIVPLDLQQVEVIKGASSTLYGGGAIAGLVNLVSKVPEEERELNFMVNGTSALGLDLSGFYGQKFGKTGTTVFASYNVGSPYDPADIGLTAIPKFNRYTINPKLFWYPTDKTTLHIGFNSTVEDRTGGAIDYIEQGNTNLYFEENSTNRFSTQLAADHQLNDLLWIHFKNSVSYYDRKIEIPSYEFSGIQLSSFNELSLNYKKQNVEWIGGLNLWTDEFSQNGVAPAQAVDYNYITGCVFIQNTWNVSEQLIVETGLRGDYQNEYGFFALPRISGLYKFSPRLSVRLGGGLGYKSPTVFTEDAEKIQFRNVLPLNAAATNAEESSGGNLDFNFKTPLGDHFTFSINSLLFYTRIDNPLVLVPTTNGFYEYRQPAGFIDTKGLETNIKLTYDDFKLFVGYTLADVNEHYNGAVTQYPLVARHRLNNVLVYEKEEKLKIGLEAYYFSPQQLSDGSTGKPYWICGLMTEKLWEHFSIFLNFENFLDTRQSRFDTIYTGSVANPVFRDIYAPVDGFVINGGLKLKL